MLTADERNERLDAIESVIGTHRAEGIRVDPEVEKLMHSYAADEITLDEFSAAVDRYANNSANEEQSLAGAA